MACQSVDVTLVKGHKGQTFPHSEMTQDRYGLLIVMAPVVVHSH